MFDRQAFEWFVGTLKYRNYGFSSRHWTSDVEDYTRRLNADGIVKIPAQHMQMLTDIQQHFFSPQGRSEEATDACYHVDESERAKNMGRVFSAYVYASSRFVFPLVSDPLMLDIIWKYLGRRPLLRNLPVIQHSHALPQSSHDIQQHFHCDSGLHQISCIYLLSDLTEQMTHTEYALASNRARKPVSHYYDRYSIDESSLQSQFEMGTITGKAGDLFIFDAGNGYHRAKLIPHTDRRIIHLNFTAGSHMVKPHFHVDPALSELIADQNMAQYRQSFQHLAAGSK
ncbi:hypothetical protein LJ739_02540 [Aestuariibacter halophilus]|uniref:Phytanoyl-CoA dioxygenase (PhyH) n=1 Tax=Fluctibacter halophilus TaxID=226011 RepID=A0ABS8G5H9_9ALTE|nr:hypothetical protein [Aestuariibacter halophilus]MCC2615120.1 hypothetical protein [Aestuariibacter halophilus]